MKNLMHFIGLFFSLSLMANYDKDVAALELAKAVDQGIKMNIITRYLQQANTGQSDDYMVINTNIPIQNDVGMTSLSIKYWGYDRSWEITPGWYYYYDKFFASNAYVSGIIGEEKNIYLMNKNNKVAIAIPTKAFSLYGTITVSSYLGGRNLPASWSEQWTISGLEKLTNDQLTSVSLESASSPHSMVAKNDIEEDLAGNKKTIKNGDLRVHNGRLTIKGTRSELYNGAVTDFGYSVLSFEGLNYDMSLIGRQEPGFQGIQSDARFAVGNYRNGPYQFSVDGSSYFKGPVKFSTSPVFEQDLFLSNKVAIGYSTPIALGDFDLVVEGKIGAREIEVKEGNWADYVFDEDYKLMPLDSLAEFVKCHRHMPNVPSATEVRQEGLSLGEITRLQQEKIEELLLYIIEQQKQLNQLSEKIQAKVE